MTALDAAVKYHGYSLEFEYYARWLDDFKVEGIIPVTHLFDDGFSLQASAMPIRKTLQVYFSGSMIFGQYGDPMTPRSASTGSRTTRGICGSP